MENFFKRRIDELDDKVSKIFNYMDNENHLYYICGKNDESMFDNLIIRFLTVSLMNNDEYNSFFGKNQDKFMEGFNEVIDFRHDKWYNEYRKRFCKAS